MPAQWGQFNSHSPVLVQNPLRHQFILYYICSRTVFFINHFKLRSFAVIAIECFFPERPAIPITKWLNNLVSNIQQNTFPIITKSSDFAYVAPLWRHGSFLDDRSFTHPVIKGPRARETSTGTQTYVQASLIPQIYNIHICIVMINTWQNMFSMAI